MPLYDLNRSNDTAIASLKVSDIVPKNWRRFPPRIAASTPQFVRDVRYINGAKGDDVSVATAAVAYTQNNSPTPENPAYAPLTQAAKAAQLGTTLAVDVTRPRGVISPSQPYPKAGDPAVAAPVISSLTPATIAIGQPPLYVVITGTGFTQWSTVKTGGVSTPYIQYISPTKMTVLMDPLRSVAGTINVVVSDHGVDSNASPFVFT